MPRTPQGRLVIVLAGYSPASRALGARWAGALFTVQRTLPEAREFYSELKARADANGRDPPELLVLLGLYPVVGSTVAEAQARKDEYIGTTLREHLGLTRPANRFAAQPAGVGA